jgi:hypothetical protein
MPSIIKTFMTSDLPSTHKDAFRFFAVAMHWYDLQSSTTTGKAPVLKCPHGKYDILFLPIRQFTGCSDYVTQEQVRVIQLNDWRKDMQAKKQLSILELATRAKDIENALQRELDKMNDDANPTVALFGESRSPFIAALITRIYIYATMIYLHVVVSGPHPDLPEIHNNVASAILAFQALPESETVHYLSWPLCIAGCMATGEQQDDFRRIATATDISRFPFGSAGHAVRIMEECWRLRRETGEVTCWRVAMRSLGLHILLV